MIRYVLVVAALLLFYNVPVFAQDPLKHILDAEDKKKAGNFAGAVDDYDKAIKIDPSNPEYVFRKGKTFILMKDMDNAIMCFEKTVQLKKEYVEAHKNLATLYKKKSKLPEAVKCYDNAFKYETEAPNKVKYKLEIIKLLAKMKKFNEAGNHINDAKQIAADNLDVLYFDARFNNTVGKYEAAKESALKATTSPNLKLDDPKNYAKYFYELGLAYYQMEKYDDATKAFEKANFGPYKRFILEMSPQYFQTLAYSYYKVFELDESETLADKALKMKKDFSAAHDLKGQIALSRTDKNAVIKAKQLAIEAEKDQVKRAQLFKELTEMLFDAGKYADAVMSADKAVEANPNDYNSLFIKAVSLARLNKNTEAIDLVQNILKMPGVIQETKAQYNFALGLFYGKTGNTKLADTSFKKAVYGPFKYAAIAELKKIGDDVEGETPETIVETGGDDEEVDK